MAGVGGRIRLYDLTTGEDFTDEDAKPVILCIKGGNAVHAMVHLSRSTGWHKLATAGNRAVRTFDLPTGTEDPARFLPDERLRVADVMQELDGSATIAAAGTSDTVHLWRGEAGTAVSFPGATGPVRALKTWRGEHLQPVQAAGAGRPDATEFYRHPFHNPPSPYNLHMVCAGSPSAVAYGLGGAFRIGGWWADRRAVLGG